MTDTPKRDWTVYPPDLVYWSRCAIKRLWGKRDEDPVIRVQIRAQLRVLKEVKEGKRKRFQGKKINADGKLVDHESKSK